MNGDPLTEAPVVSTDAVVVDRLARIETKLDAIKEDRVQQDRRLDGFGSRLDRVERFMWLAVGMAAAASLPDLASAVASVKS